MGSKTVHTRNRNKYKKARQMRKQKMPIVQIAKTLQMSTNAIYKWTTGIECPYHNPRYNTDCIDNEYFSRQNLANYPERFVIIGFIAADGCISDTKKGQATLCFNIAQKDQLALEIINQEIAGEERKISAITKTNSCIITFPSDEICSDLSKFNIVPRKTSTYTLPRLKSIAMKYFLRGYFYGDGCISGKGSHQVCMFIGTRAFIQELHSYLLVHDIISTAGVYLLHNSDDYLHMRTKNKEASKLTQYLFDDDKMVLLPRKHKIVVPVIRGSRWNKKEEALLLRTSLEKFCELTGRTMCAAKDRKGRLSTNLAIGNQSLRE